MLIALDLKGFMSPTKTNLEEIMKRETQTVEFMQSWHDEYLEVDLRLCQCAGPQVDHRKPRWHGQCIG